MVIERSDSYTIRMASSSPARSPRPASTILIVLYLVLAVVGLIGTWFFNISYFTSEVGDNYITDWFSNAASSSVAVDVIVTAFAACVLYVVEGRRLGWSRWSLLLVPFTFAIALAVTFPVFLALREITLLRRTHAAS